MRTIATYLTGRRNLAGSALALLAAALLRLLTDPKLSKRLGAAGRRRVEEGYERGAAVAELRRQLAPLIAS